ncbi:MAG: hypothetical protein P4L72_11245 [Parvibaculum sp.]|uniref:hypothetical protein n=1 Tax=Parvibaculum sp. TaxID=2024848 RepID=UPI002850A515|nr:hypothetical protein [Parvibaculum sp.]MDR3499786.1 hypothetical protein [Parvibaculum sp.]
MSHTIRYRRPETRESVGRIFVPSGIDAAKQVRRLQGLGYTILEVLPAPSDIAPIARASGNGSW